MQAQVAPVEIFNRLDTLVMAAMAQEPEEIKDMEAFLKMAKYPLVKHTDMTQEMREEAMDTCITAVEKHHADMEKCTQVSFTRSENSLQVYCKVHRDG